MALTRAQSNVATGSGVAPTVDIGSVPAAGDLIVVSVAIATTGRTISLSGFTLIPTNGNVSGGTVIQHAVFYKVATGVAGTDVITASVSGSSVSWRIVAVQYHDSAGGTWTLDQSAKSSSASNVSTANSGTTAATSSANEVWVGVLSDKPSITQTSPSNSFVLVQGGASPAPSYLYEKIVAATATANVTATLTTATKYAGTIATFYAGSPGVPGPVNTVAPAVTGTATVGSTLSCSTGSWTNSPTGYTYQWQHDNFGDGSYSNIVGATANTYVLVADEDSRRIRCVVIASNATGSSSPTNSNAVGPIIVPAPVNTAVPGIFGETTQYKHLTLSPGTWSNMGGHTAVYTFQWQSSPDGTGSWTNLTGAVATTYVIRTADVGVYLRAVVTATNSGGTANAAAAAVGPVIPVPNYRYENLEPSYDWDNVYNRWTGTREDGSPQTWEDAQSQEDYFLRVKQVNSLVSTDAELLNQLQWKTAQYSQPMNRVERITIRPLRGLAGESTVHSVSLFGFGEGLYGSGTFGVGGEVITTTLEQELEAGFGREIGDRIIVKETPPGFGFQEETEYMIQHVSGQVDVGPLTSATLTFQLWPTSMLAFWLVGDPERSLAGQTTRPSY